MRNVLNACGCRGQQAAYRRLEWKGLIPLLCSGGGSRLMLCSVPVGLAKPNRSYGRNEGGDALSTPGHPRLAIFVSCRDDAICTGLLLCSCSSPHTWYLKT
ncbi:Hypothetical protein NTJ_02444 [Nesidiocoris tenuis]|uniref:Uncharacterized protein n=1 Tax=Nesidiocoris tenuis TaxID=355587 RepID=A0ABN7ABF4_9HEMI|nr:Hypothetical protein NTJ_02444 [Nesidiocoris tenuis]